MDTVEKGDVISTPLGVMIVAKVSGEYIHLLGVVNVYDKNRIWDKVVWDKIKHICQPATAQDFVADSIRLFDHFEKKGVTTTPVAGDEGFRVLTE